MSASRSRISEWWADNSAAVFLAAIMAVLAGLWMLAGALYVGLVVGCCAWDGFVSREPEQPVLNHGLATRLLACAVIGVAIMVVRYHGPGLPSWWF